MRDKAKQVYVGTGAIVSDITPNASDPLNSQMIPQQFNMLTISNELQWNAVESTRGKKTYDNVDVLVNFAQKHNMSIRGHCLVTHNLLPKWVNDKLNETELKEALKSRIK